ncbi:hypothetical protein [Aeromonas caviae]|uniref:hypothetical protein n=1 Tax=Aeromonas caviae TaxID=648 RepID=UPI00206E9B6E|nr:MAG TPA: hypothetical protein [Caudoviricetes sp.]
MSEQINDNKIKLLHQRIYAAISVTRNGSGSRSLCEPFNPGPAMKVERLATSVLGMVLTRLLDSAPSSVVEQLIADIDDAVVKQGTFNVGRDRSAMVQQATFGPLARASVGSLAREAAPSDMPKNADL